MRLLDYLYGGLALLALPVVFSWGIYQSPQSAVNLEARLEAKARAALAAANVDWAEVRMQGQRAILSGAAPSADAVQEAAEAIRASNGPGGLLFGGVTLIENRAVAAAPVSSYVWRARKMPEGTIILEGHVPSRAIRTSLVQEARLIGRSPAEDRMELMAGAPGGNFQGVARLAIRELARLDSGEAEIRDTRVILRGETSDPAVRAQASAAIAGIGAPFRGEPLLKGGPVWRAEVSEGALVLSGAVAGEMARREILARAHDAFEGEVRDLMTASEAAPEYWTPGALAGLTHLAAFQAGALSYDPATRTFIVEGEASASTLYFMRRDMARSGRAWRTVMDVAPRAEAAFEVAGFATSPAPADACDADLRKIRETGPPAFIQGQAEISRDSAAALDRLAATLLRCDPALRIELAVPGGDPGSGLAVQRAEALAEYFSTAGIPRGRIAAIAYGPQGAGEYTDETSGGAEAQTVGIRLVERSME